MQRYKYDKAMSSLQVPEAEDLIAARTARRTVTGSSMKRLLVSHPLDSITELSNSADHNQECRSSEGGQMQSGLPIAAADAAAQSGLASDTLAVAGSKGVDSIALPLGEPAIDEPISAVENVETSKGPLSNTQLCINLEANAQGPPANPTPTNTGLFSLGAPEAVFMQQRQSIRPVLLPVVAKKKPVFALPTSTQLFALAGSKAKKVRPRVPRNRAVCSSAFKHQLLPCGWFTGALPASVPSHSVQLHSGWRVVLSTMTSDAG